MPGRIVEIREGAALVDFQGNRMEVCTVMTPEVGAGDWVLVHAGFAITPLDEETARQTWTYLNAMRLEPTGEARGVAEHGDE